jgi:hypothetical protein
VFDVTYNSDMAVAGFQFTVSGPTVLGASGGAAADAGFTVQTGSTGVVLGFSFEGASSPAGSGVLTTLLVQGDISGYSLGGGVLTGTDGSTLAASLDDSGFAYCSADADSDGTCDGIDDCVGEYDECGECNGGGIADGTCDCDGTSPDEGHDCDGNCVVEVDCEGVCGGSSSEDDCGVCNGDGSSCLASLSLGAFDSSGTLEVIYDFGSDVAGFQFDVSGLALAGGSGGAAGDAGFEVQAGSSGTVVGFSFTVSTPLPAGIVPRVNEKPTTVPLLPA